VGLFRARQVTARLHRVEILLPSDEERSAELIALVRTDREGKISYPLPTEVSDKIGRYPSKLVAAVLSTIAAPPPGKLQQQPGSSTTRTRPSTNRGASQVFASLFASDCMTF
jgi:hypothetical protein